MTRYIALLRGVNIGGNNKISMSELKNELEKLGFVDIKTVLNSGNIVFSSEINDCNLLLSTIKAMINDSFSLVKNSQCQCR